MSNFVPGNYDLRTVLIFCYHLKKHRIVTGDEGEKAVYNFINSNEKKYITTLITENAARELTPPMIMEFVANIFHPWLFDKKIPLPVVLYVIYTAICHHITMALSDFCFINQIILMALFLQLMDVTMFHPLKQA
ncbi:hypothetical protein ALC53_06692 [Atta colombica]|uniref:Uncharacterized protein n=1 Tax=Atta colombica TaxID=520822 RepID=A0A151I311_9HYME|nr:hypothetical protein ALC53_06692 [Atta colombica]